MYKSLTTIFSKKKTGQDKYAHFVHIGDKDYLDCVNQFWGFYKRTRGYYLLPFFEYLNDTERKKRLVYNNQNMRWDLLSQNNTTFE